jgi:hypothetical protein
MNTSGSNMIIVRSSFGGQPNFTLIPVTMDCAYVEALFEPVSKSLVIFNKCTQTKFRMIPKINESGDHVMPKKPRPDRQTYCEERKQMESFYEHYLVDPQDIREFVKRFAVNADNIDIEPFLTPPVNTGKKEESTGKPTT